MQLTRTARRLSRRLAAGAASRLPAHVGPAGWGEFVLGTRLRRAEQVLESDPQETLTLLEPMLAFDPGPRTLLLSSRALERLGDVDGALAAAEQANEPGRRTPATLEAYLRLARRTGHAARAREVLDLVAATVPRTPRQADALVALLRGAPREVLDRFAATVAEAGAPGLEEARELLDEDDLVTAHGQGQQEFSTVSTRVLQTRVRPVAVLTRALVRVRAWQQAADVVATVPGGQQVGPQASTEIPARDIATAAVRALAAGHPTPAAMLAARALAADPGVSRAQETFTSAQDQLRVVRRGWSPPPLRPTPAYPPDPSAALAVLSQSMPHTSGGYATRTHGILTGLAAQGRRIEAVTRLGFPYDRWPTSSTQVVPASDTVDGIVYHRILTDARRYPQYPLADYVEATAAGVERIARSRRAALVHASSFYVAGLAGITAARRLGVPFLYEMRGLEELMKVSRDPSFAGSGREAFLRELETGLATRADAALLITRALRDEMVDRGVPEDRAVVVPNGVHSHLFRPVERDRELEAELGLRDRTVIGYVGGLVDYEGVDLLLEAVARLRTRREDDFRVLVVGDGPYEQRVREVCVEAGLQDVVLLTGRVPHAEVSRYLSLVDVAPFPRKPLPVCEMISPIKPLESMAMGKAVLASDVAALAEMVQDGVTGRLFRKGDVDHLAAVLGELLDDPAQRHTLGAAARSWVVRERDWSGITAIVDDVYTEVLDRAGGGA